MEKKNKHLIRYTYYTAKIVFTSKPLLTTGGKDPVSNFNKSMIVYQYSCCCTASYIGLMTRQLRKRIIEHVSKSVDNFGCLDKRDNISAKVLNDSKLHLLQNI